MFQFGWIKPGRECAPVPFVPSEVEGRGDASKGVSTEPVPGGAAGDVEGLDTNG